MMFVDGGLVAAVLESEVAEGGAGGRGVGARLSSAVWTSQYQVRE